MKTIQDLRQSLIDDREKMLDGRIKLPMASERTANANAIIKTCMAELAFYALSKQVPDMPFIAGASAREIKRIK